MYSKLIAIASALALIVTTNSTALAAGATVTHMTFNDTVCDNYDDGTVSYDYCSTIKGPINIVETPSGNIQIQQQLKFSDEFTYSSPWYNADTSQQGVIHAHILQDDEGLRQAHVKAKIVFTDNLAGVTCTTEISIQYANRELKREILNTVCT